MSMSKKDFVALADVIRAANEPFKRGDFYPISSQGFFDRNLVGALADFCAAQNPRFDRARWLAYIADKCGPNGGKVTGPTGRRHAPACSDAYCSCGARNPHSHA